MTRMNVETTTRKAYVLRSYSKEDEFISFHWRTDRPEIVNCADDAERFDAFKDAWYAQDMLEESDEKIPDDLMIVTVEVDYLGNVFVI